MWRFDDGSFLELFEFFLEFFKRFFWRFNSLRFFWLFRWFLLRRRQVGGLLLWSTGLILIQPSIWIIGKLWLDLGLILGGIKGSIGVVVLSCYRLSYYCTGVGVSLLTSLVLVLVLVLSLRRMLRLGLYWR
jgi:hypothetical protein